MSNNLIKNMKTTHGAQRGIVRTIIIIVIALLALSYYGFNLRSTVEAPLTQSNFSYVWSGVTYTWNTYLKNPATYLFNFFVTNIWNPSIGDIQRINNGQLPNIELKGPQANPAPITQ